MNHPNLTANYCGKQSAIFRLFISCFAFDDTTCKFPQSVPRNNVRKIEMWNECKNCNFEDKSRQLRLAYETVNWQTSRCPENPRHSKGYTSVYTHTYPYMNPNPYMSIKRYTISDGKLCFRKWFCQYLLGWVIWLRRGNVRSKRWYYKIAKYS